MEKEKEEEFKGLFADNLFRGNSKIKRDRAISIIKRSKNAYRRYIEDLQLEIEELKARQNELIDLSPTDNVSLTMAKNFDPDDFLRKDTDLIAKIFVKETHLELYKKRQEKLFG